jgi:hypothetical protein
MTPFERLQPPTLPLSLVLLRLVGIAAIVLVAPRAEAQPDAVWSASGEVLIRYRTTMGGPLYGRTTALIPDTAETDLIDSIEVGATSGSPTDDDPGSLSLSNIGDAATPRDLGDVDVNIGTFSLNDSFVTGRFDVDKPTSVMVMRLSGVGGQGVLVRDGGTFTAEASQISGTVRAGGMARVSGCTGGLGSVIGADIEIDGSILGSTDFQGKQVITNSSITTFLSRVRQGEFDFENVSLDVESEFSVGGNTTGAVPTDTSFMVTGSAFESATALVRAGVGIATDLTMRGSTWRSFGLFQIGGALVDIGSGSHIDARADLVVGNSHVTVASIAEESRIDVAGDFDLDGSASTVNFDPPTLLTVGPGGVVEVQGTLTIGEFSTLTIDGGTVRVGALDNQGTLNDPAGALTVPEATGAAPVIAAALGLALLRRRRD